MPLSNHWYAARFLVVSTSVWLFVRSLSVFVNSVFHGSSHSSKAGRLGVSAKWSPSKRLFSMKVMRWPVSCLQIIVSFFLQREFLARNVAVLEIFGIIFPPVCTHISACIRLLPTHIPALAFSKGAILTQTWQVQLKNVSELWTFDYMFFSLCSSNLDACAYYAPI